MCSVDQPPEQPSDGLTINESAAIRLYTREWCKPHQSFHSMLNRALSNTDREKLRPYVKYMKLFLAALLRLTWTTSTTVWRGAFQDKSLAFPAGTTVTWWSFSSCTTELPVLENNINLDKAGERTLFSVEAFNGRTLGAHSHFVNEDEVLLLPDTHMAVQSQFSPAPNLHIIHVKQKIWEEVLLTWLNEGISTLRCTPLPYNWVSITSFFLNCNSKIVFHHIFQDVHGIIRTDSLLQLAYWVYC